MTQQDRYVQICRGSWQIVFVKHLRPKLKADPEPEPASGLVKQLTDRGVTATTAAELAAAYANRIPSKLEVFDFLAENNDKRLSHNPGGYLVQSIRDDYAPPKGFTPRPERERIRKAAEDRKLQKEEANRQKQEREKAREQRKREHVARIRATLTEAELQEFERLARIETFDPFRKYFDQNDDYALRIREGLINGQILKKFPVPAPPEPAD